METLREEGCPVIWSNGGQRLNKLLKGEGNNLGPRVAFLTIEEGQEVIKRFFTTGLIADDRIDLQPNQFTFAIKVKAPNRQLS